MQEVNGWFLPDADNYFAAYAAQAPRGENGFQREHLTQALELVRGSALAVDAGAHVGFYAREMADRFAAVHAFEPAPDSFRCLEQNLAGHAHVRLYNLALGDREGSCRMREDADRAGNTGARYVGEGDDVLMAPLDSLRLPACDFLKVDVEGYEWRVLQGAAATIGAFRPVILIETAKKFAQKRYGDPDQGAERWLVAQGYREAAYLRPNKIFVPA